MELLSKRNRVWLKAYLKTDRAKLMICIGIAFVFWVFTKMSKIYSSQLTLEMDYQPQRAWAFLEKPDPDEVSFELEGTGWALLQGHLFGFPRSLVVPLDDRENSTVSGSALRTKLQVQLDDDIKVTASSEEAILIELDSAERKKVPVVLKNELDFAEGYQLSKNITFEPDSIFLFGPKRLISTYEEYRVQRIVKQGINKSVQLEIPLQKPPQNEIRLSQDNVTVLIETELFEQRKMTIPITILNGQDSIYLNETAVVVYGNIGNSHISEVDFENIKALVDFNTAKGKEHLIVELIDLPQHLSNVRYYPQSVGFYVVK